MSIFLETMTKAIADYRLLLRKYLNQVERMNKLQKLSLRDSEIYTNDLIMFQVGNAIVKDMEEHMVDNQQGYYSYSGIREFCNYLKDYLSNYSLENNRVVHRTQKASRVLLHAIQLMGMPREKLNEGVAKKLLDCNKVVANFGSDKQCELHMQTLLQQQPSHPGFYTSIIAHMESLLMNSNSAAA